VETEKTYRGGNGKGQERGWGQIPASLNKKKHQVPLNRKQVKERRERKNDRRRAVTKKKGGIIGKNLQKRIRSKNSVREKGQFQGE